MIRESAIDFPMEDLDLSIWDKDGDSYVLGEDVKASVLGFIGQYRDADLLDIAGADDSGNKHVHITGSIGTNQWTKDSDVDIHIVLPEDSKYFNDEDFQEVVKRWSADRDFKISGHPVEIYMQSDMNQEYLADACYNVMTGEWLKGPKIVPQDYDPYEDFAHVFDDLRSEVSEIDLLFGELRRDVIDYEVIKSAIKQMPKDVRQKLLSKLEAKLREIEDDIDGLYRKRKELVKARSLASGAKSKEQALIDKELIKSWGDKNATFKFIARYQYLRVIKELQDIVDDSGELAHKDVDKVKDTIEGE
jgi:hypothetical protein